MNATPAPRSTSPADGTDTAAAPSFWGRSSRLGGGTGRLIAASLVLGLLIAALAGAIAYGLAGTSNPADPRQAWGIGLIIAAGALPVAAAVVWILLVDRNTISGAIRDPEESIEVQWYDAAARGAFHDVLVVVGLGAVLVAVTRWEASLSLVGIGLILFMAGDVAVRYQVMKRRG